MSHTPIHIDERTIALLVPSFIGSIVAVTRSPKMSVKEAVVRIFSGTATSYYITPLVADLMRLDGNTANHWFSSLGFLVGMTGYALIPTLSKAVTSTIQLYIKEYRSK